MVSPKKVHVQTTGNFRLQKIAQAVIKLSNKNGITISVTEFDNCLCNFLKEVRC